MSLSPERRVAEREVLLPVGTTPSGTRGRILEGALGLFAEHGFAGTSIRAIGTEVGITSASLYAHYPSKEEILRELVMIGISELQLRLTEAVADVDTPVEKLAELVSAHVRAHASFALLAVVTNTEVHALSTGAGAPAVAIRAGLQQLLVDVLEEGQASGDFSIPDVALAARAIAGMGMHVGTWFHADAPDDAERVAAGYAEFALRIAGVK